MTTSSERAFCARTSSVPEVCAFVESWCAAQGIVGEPALRLRLIAEELFVNSVVHGYRADSEASVTLCLRAAASGIELVVADAAPPFDPFAQAPAVAASGNPAERPIGKLGLPLVVQLAARHGYRRVDGRNEITVALDLAGPAQP